MKPITAPPSNAASASRDDDVSPGVWLALWLLRGYKVLFSPYFRGSCRFLPSCADYAAQAVARANLALPDYAQVKRWQVRAPFDPTLGELTNNGRPRRAVLLSRHSDFIQAF